MNFDHVFACLERASQLSDDVARACDAATALVEWRSPAMSAASLLTLLALALLTDGEHAIAVPFLVALAAMGLALGERVSGEYQLRLAGNDRFAPAAGGAGGGGAGGAGGGGGPLLRRPVAFARVSVVEARNLVNADVESHLGRMLSHYGHRGSADESGGAGGGGGGAPFQRGPRARSARSCRFT